MSKALDWLKNKSWPIAIIVVLLSLVSGSVGQYVQDEPADVVNVGNTTLTGNTTLVVPEAFWSPPKDVPAATAFVISNDVSARVRAAAIGMKQVYGALIQICNGVNDQVEIQAAVTAAAGGDTCLSFGDYDIRDETVMPTDSTIYGAGAGTKLIIPDGLNGTFNVISSTGTTGVVIRDLMIDGGTQTGGVNAAVFFDTVSECAILDCFISMPYWAWEAVWLTASTDCIIQNNVFSLCGLAGLGLDASSDRNRITDNHFKVCGDGIDLYASNHNIIQGNQFEDGDYNADIYLMDASHNNLIDSNNIYNPAARGIVVQDGGTFNVITNNNMTATGEHGIYVVTDCHYNTVIGNRLEGGGDYGFVISESDYCTVEDNHIEDTEYDGIWIHDSHHTIVSGNFVIGAGQGMNYYDIFIEESNYCLVEGNLVRAGVLAEQPDHGINIDAGIGTIVRNNSIYDDGFAIAPFQDIGIDTGMHEIFIPYPDPDGSIGTHPALVLTDGADVTGNFEVVIPMNFQQAVHVDLIIVPAGTGNMRRSVDTNWGKVGTAENYNAGTDAIVAGQVAVTVSDLELIDILAAFTGIAGGDSIGVEFTRVGTHVDDTVNADCYLVGFRMLYV